ncbi:prephenate dehydratase [Secundilactobacillus kimchicus]|uniref:prephenate dehydratase n=1 Tax=Secundilactobacillus kimchicus TaxID=528209 RepID=UPI001C00E9AC|nr:prephenate dehydratase domain-containing protein [Secundilactobacillus kimchicus]MBT9672300.1 prephenate dehydratase [Secundilactobacillus kimchicus]
MKFSVLGPAGTFADAAAHQYLSTTHQTATIDYHATFEQVYQAVAPDGIGLLPIENQLDGFVMATLQRLQSEAVTIIGETTIPVNFGLAAQADSLSAIKRVYVQFKTEGQCQNLLSSLPNAEIITTSSNMVSVEKLQHGKPGDAAIIPQSQMALNAFPLMRDNVADQLDNFTRFTIFKKSPTTLAANTTFEAAVNRFKCPIFVTPPTDDPGTLYEILGYPKRAQLNLATLMSLPTKQKMGIYSFYIEISGTTAQLDDLQATLTEMARVFTVQPLGVYGL